MPHEPLEGSQTKLAMASPILAMLPKVRHELRAFCGKPKDLTDCALVGKLRSIDLPREDWRAVKGVMEVLWRVEGHFNEVAYV